ncbi:MAG: hypothetical protein HY840_06705 [Bacteroidetes bacterium]|nr:hypothetical protein [Bacteroidota bacterium]
MMKYLKIISVYFFIVLAFSIVGFYTYTHIKTAWVVNNFINSEHYRNRVEEFIRNPPKSKSIIFLGNSHTEHFDLELYGFPDIVNRGITGDFTEGVLLRLKESVLNEPQKIFIEIGTNDIIEKVTENEICKNYDQIISRILKEAPLAEIYIQSIFPVSVKGSFFTSNKDVNNRITSVNAKLKVLAKRHHLTYIDLYDRLSEDNSLRSNLDGDGIHLNKKGYAIWAKELKHFIN